MSPATVAITVNGEPHEAQSGHGLTLLSYLRGELGLKGARQGCDQGGCGACTVVLDGVAVQSCQLSLSAVDGGSVETIEGLRTASDGAAVVQALTEVGAAQCGYCLSGIIASAVAAMRRQERQTDLRSVLERNICRCGTQHRILRALERARYGAGTNG